MPPNTADGRLVPWRRRLTLPSAVLRVRLDAGGRLCNDCGMRWGSRYLLAVCGLAIAALALSASRPAKADDISTRFEVFGFAGIKVLTMHSRTDEDSDRYAVSVDYATKGIASVFVDLRTRAQVAGRLTAASAAPLSFRNDSVRNGVERHNRVTYGPDGSVDGTSVPALSDPVRPATQRGTVDNLTAYFRLERQLGMTGKCALSERVFDGRHGYDLAFSDAGRVALTPAGGQQFSGTAVACHMTRRNWPGFPDPEKNEGARSGTIWYSRLLPGDLMVPIRMQMDTQLGVVEGYLAELHGRGVNLKLME